MSRVIFEGKLLGETSTVQFSFLSRLGASETISSASIAASVYSGTDAAPSAIINGSASIGGSTVSQSITGGTLGVTYELLCTANTSLSQVLQLSGFLVIMPDLE